MKIIIILGLSLKDRFGDKFSFWGAIDQQDLLPNGSDKDL
jgi:uroporphyrinogen decarboxylase